MMETTTHSPSLYWKTCAALMALLALTWTIGYVNLGLFNVVVALAISIVKALLVALLFMHIKGSSRLLHLAATAGVIWLLILFSLTLGDYFTRNFLQPTSSHKVPPEQFHGAPSVEPLRF